MSSDKTNSTIRELYEKYGIDRKYDHPSNVSEENSYFGNGDYPPDWTDRREAVLEHQNGRCARCHISLSDEDYFNCHHYRPVSKNGQHSLSNLVNLCADCHKLIHPDVENLDGEWRDAPIFPHPDADPRMATVRRPVTDGEKQEFQPEISLIADKSPVGENEFANSAVTIPVSPGDALRMRDEFDQLLEDMGLANSTALTIRTVNSEHSPLRDSLVEVAFPTSGTKMSSRTDKHGEVEFSIPSGTSVELGITKDGFNQTTSSFDVGEDDDYQEITLETSDQAGATGATPSTDSATPEGGEDESRRPILKTLGLVGVGGIAGYFFSGDSNQHSSVSGNDVPGGDGPDTTQSDSPTSNDTPVKGFTEEWTDAIDTYETITTLEKDDSAIYAGTDSSLVRSLSPEGDENWTQDFDGQMVHLGTTSDTLILVTTSLITALRKDSGETRWSVSHNATSNESNPSAANNDDVIVLASNGQEDFLQAFSTSTGDTIWEVTDEPSSDPVFLNGSLFYSRYDLAYIEEPEQSGEKSPVTIPETGSYSGGLAMGESLAYYITGGGERGGAYSGSESIELHAVEIEREEVVWRETVASGINSEDVAVSPSVSGPTINSGVFIYTTGGIWYGDFSGEQIWTHGDYEARFTKPVWLRDTLFYDSNGGLTGCQKSDGAVTHRVEIDDEVVTLNSYDESVIVGTESGKIRMLTPD
ncbi:HNH endonuclease [Halorubrum xinjiangense]|uniref:HNH endonuclease n=1 Tax=Halorubrum xinjiangense TaxID=261291 RepID=A0A1G7KRE5_9EURY|nr:PQQ-binding-like beta-propeller repeat protein [Halorubrum xinjiangense]SDF39773.1 HNH endonuclease [Halorubrum xinjiangense]